MKCFRAEQIESLARRAVVSGENGIRDLHLRRCRRCRGEFDEAVENEQALSKLRQLGGSELLSSPDKPPAPPLPDQIGRYKIIRELGQGGTGTVYEGQQEWPIKRTVALKVIKLGTDSRAIIARFESERQTLAMMDHPNIAKVLDAGATENGQPFFAMELIEGTPITQYCDEHRLTISERLHLFVQVCHGVQHAHQKGVIHRDIKPSNVLVTEYDGMPVPKVIDFGVAKALGQGTADETIVTHTGQLVGTLQCMSPEQIQMQSDIDTQTDVYSLGVLLYELLVGVLPFKTLRQGRHSPHEIQRVVMEEDPYRPSSSVSDPATDATVHASKRGVDPKTLHRQLRRDLDWIVLKALEKDRSRRYQSAAALAEDIQRYLRREPLEAHPPAWTYRLNKFVDRNRVLVASAAAVLVVLVGGLLASTVYAVRASKAEREARHQTDVAQQREMKARWQEYRANIAAADAALKGHDTATAHERLDAAPAEFRKWEWRYLSARADESLASFAGHEKPVWSVAYDPTGTRLVTGSEDRTIRIWDAATGKELAQFKGHTGIVYSVVFSPDGGRLVSASEDNTVRVWDVSTGQEISRQEHSQ